MERIDPTDILGINERLLAWASSGEAIRPVAIERLVVADDAIDAFVDIVRQAAGSGNVLMVVDRTPMRRGGEDVKALLADRLGRGGPLRMLELPEEQDAGSGRFHATMAAAKALAPRMRDHAAVVSVGSGSITDVVKYARHLALEEAAEESLPFICFPTAASVTAFTSALSVLSVEGVKRTIASRPPTAVVCDLKTIAEAPPIMVQAGFGDVIARSVAYGDYYLANEIGMDDGFSLVPGNLLAWAEQAMIESADYVACRDLAGVRTVTEALLLAGMAMSVVNQTAPISGWEHVISHYLDMTAAFDAREQALHGGQVGVATLVSARAYERGWPNLDVDRLTSVAGSIDADAERVRLETLFGPYDGRGSLVAEIWRDYNRKMQRWQQATVARDRFVSRYRGGEFEPFLRQNVRPAADVEAALTRAGAPRRFDDLDQPVPAPSAHAAVLYGHLIRARFTFGDLLEAAGWLDAKSAESILAER